MHRFFHQPVLGTSLSVIVSPGRSATGDITDLARYVDDVVVAEVQALEASLSVFDRGSELERWKRGELRSPSEAFCTVMREAVEWQRRSEGAFQPMIGELLEVWRAAADVGVLPDADAVTRVAHQIAASRVVFVDGVPVPTGDVAAFNLHAYAKGWIVDRALSAVFDNLDVGDHFDRGAFTVDVGAAGGVDAVNIVVNAGGDLAHRGPDPQTVGIEHPNRNFDNEPPIDRVRVANAGLATSGSARRGFRVGQRWFSHVLDPRTGQPVDHHRSISVVASSAGVADVVATIAGVERVEVALERAEEFGVACMLVDDEGNVVCNDAWARLRPR